MTPTSDFPSLSRGDRSDVLLATKSQLSRLGYRVGDSDSPEFDHQFDSVIRRFQQERGLLCDGLLGPETFAQIELARYRLGDRVLRFDPVRPLRGDDVAELQKILSRLGIYTHRIDYIFAEATDAAVREAQTGLGLRSDGIAGPTTLAGLRAVKRDQGEGDVFALQERARVTASGPSLAGRVVVIEAATTRTDFVTTSFGPGSEARAEEYAADIARRLEGRLSALGAATVFVEDSADRATLGDELGASAIVTINLDSSASPKAQGAATYYFGRGDDPSVASPVGRRLAELMQKELCARTGFLDCRSHPRTWESLRRVRSPKVHVMPGYISNAEDRAALEDSHVRDIIAESIAVSLQRLYLRKETDPPTGTLDLAAVRSQL